MKKRRKPGTACAGGKRCTGIHDYTRINSEGEPKTYRLCTKHLADWMFGDQVRAAGVCFARGERFECSPALQCAHIRSRRYMSLRWSFDNAVCLCSAHHAFYTQSPLEWEQFCIDRGIDYDDLRRRGLNDPPMDPLEVVLTLQERQA